MACSWTGHVINVEGSKTVSHGQTRDGHLLRQSKPCLAFIKVASGEAIEERDTKRKTGEISIIYSLRARRGIVLSAYSKEARAEKRGPRPQL